MLERVRHYIEVHGGQFGLGKSGQKVVIDRGKVTGFEAGRELLPFDKVLSTIPIPYVPRVMPVPPANILDALRSVKNVQMVCVIAKLEKLVTESFWLNTNDPKMDIPGTFEYTNLRPLNDHVVYVPFYISGEHPK